MKESIDSKHVSDMANMVMDLLEKKASMIAGPNATPHQHAKILKELRDRVKDLI